MTRRDHHSDRPRRMSPVLPRIGKLAIDHREDEHGRPVVHVRGLAPDVALHPIDLRSAARQLEAAADLADGAG